MVYRMTFLEWLIWIDTVSRVIPQRRGKLASALELEPANVANAPVFSVGMVYLDTYNLIDIFGPGMVQYGYLLHWNWNLPMLPKPTVMVCLPGIVHLE